jgi:hypothetical protein
LRDNFICSFAMCRVEPVRERGLTLEISEPKLAKNQYNSSLSPPDQKIDKKRPKKAVLEEVSRFLPISKEEYLAVIYD